jgi:hypothetical protein
VRARIASYVRQHHLALLCLFLILGGGTAWALERNSVKSNHIVNGQVKPADVRDDSLAGGGLTGDDIREDTLGGVPFAQDSNVAASLNGKTDDDFVAAQGAEFTNIEISSWTPGEETCPVTNDWAAISWLERPGYWRDPFGMVHLRGFAHECGAAPDLIFTLPAGHRPAKQSHALVPDDIGTGDQYERITIEPSGAVRFTVYGTNTAAASHGLSFDGVSFRCAPSGQNGCP